MFTGRGNDSNQYDVTMGFSAWAYRITVSLYDLMHKHHNPCP